jgi:hypothetical protein
LVQKIKTQEINEKLTKAKMKNAKMLQIKTK